MGYKLIALAPSRSRPSADPHRVSVNEKDELTCDCKGWIFSLRRMGYRTCPHVEAVEEYANGRAESYAMVRGFTFQPEFDSWIVRRRYLNTDAGANFCRADLCRTPIPIGEKYCTFHRDWEKARRVQNAVATSRCLVVGCDEPPMPASVYCAKHVPKVRSAKREPRWEEPAPKKRTPARPLRTIILDDDE